MGTKLEAATQGRIKLQMFRGSVLGGEKEVIWQTQVGAIQILRTSLGPSGGPGGGPGARWCPRSTCSACPSCC
jgi:hypothetical protein